jgi:membrane protein YdbS with pleckstrin-like domain
MSEKGMGQKKGKNFKQVIEEEKNKGKTTKKIMRIITSLDTSVVYGGSFLLVFIVLNLVVYFSLSPGVFVWAGSLVVTAVASSVLASRITKMLKNNQWKYKV